MTDAGLGRRRAVVFAGLALLSALVAGGYAAVSWTGAARHASRALFGVTRLMATAVRWRLADNHAALVSLGREIAHLPRLDHGGDYARIGQLGRQFVAHRPAITALAVLGPHGSVWWRTPPPPGIPRAPGASGFEAGPLKSVFRVEPPTRGRGIPMWLTVQKPCIRFHIWAMWSPGARPDTGLGRIVRGPTVMGLFAGRGPIVPIGSRAPMGLAAVHLPIIGPRPAGRLTVDLRGRDGPWIGAYRRIPGYPLTVLALRPLRAVYARGRQAAYVAALWLVTVLAAIGLLYRTMARAEAALAGERAGAQGRWAQAKIQIEGIVQSLAWGVFATDHDGRIEYLNRAAERLTGWTKAEVQGRVLHEVLPCLDEYRGDPFDPLAACLDASSPVFGEALMFHRDGHGLVVEYEAAPCFSPDGRISGAVLSLRDAAQKRALTEHLAHQATHDPLTELPNRILFHERLEHALAEARAGGGAAALLFLDVDGFKQVNDTLGHSTGDHVLVLIGERLQRLVRATDTLARLGGDEFAVVLPGLRTGQDARPVVHKIIAAFREPLKVASGEIVLGMSIGIAVYPQDSGDSRALVRAADAAMYEAKAAGKNTYRFFDASHQSRPAAYPRVSAAHLRQAFERDEFFLVYQPQLRAANLKLAAMEALLRWTHPTEGIKYPGEFLAALEEAGLMTEVGAWVLRSACRQNRRWRDAGLSTFPVAVNMSGRQCAHESLVETVDRALSEWGLRPDDLVLELAEDLLVDVQDEVAERLRDLQRRGVRLVVQNFGGVSSTLGMLRRLHVDALKIESAFVAQIGEEHNDAVVEAIIALGSALGLRVIASGVETAAQYRFLKEAGCDVLQGRYIAAPLDVEAATAYLQDPGPASG